MEGDRRGVSSFEASLKGKQVGDVRKTQKANKQVFLVIAMYDTPEEQIEALVICIHLIIRLRI